MIFAAEWDSNTNTDTRAFVQTAEVVLTLEDGRLVGNSAAKNHG